MEFKFLIFVTVLHFPSDFFNLKNVKIFRCHNDGSDDVAFLFLL